MDSYVGLTALGTTGAQMPFSTATPDGAVIVPDAAPGYRVHSPSGPLDSVSGTATRVTSGAAITGATNATPIVITAANHGLVTGDTIVVSGVLGNTAANGTFQVIQLSANTFSLTTSVGNGAYTSGGVFAFSGLWKVTLDVTEANGFVEGDNYTLELTFLSSTVPYRNLLRFSVG